MKVSFRRSPLVVTVTVAAVFAVYWFLDDLLGLLPAYGAMFERYGFAVPRSLRSLIEIVLVVTTVLALHRLRLGAAWRELGVRPPIARGVLFGLVATAPMALAFATTHPFDPDPALQIFYLSFLSPFAEELVFRGFLVGQLWRRAGWGLWPAILVSSLIFGWDHADNADSFAEGAGLLLLTGVGAAIFAWLYARWRTLAAPIALHVAMNLCWALWQVGDGALAGWVPTALQLTTVTLAIVLTVVGGRRGWLGEPFAVSSSRRP